MNNATKTIPQILRDNICTIFNALNLMIAVALAAVGAWKNILFLLIILANTVIGVVQEIRAKRQIERLTLLTQPVVTLLRNGAEVRVNPESVQAGDRMALTGGSVVCTDCVLQEGRLEMNESILTGESEPVVKLPGDKLLSGSSVIAGRGLARAECGADQCFTARMVDEVKRTSGGSSELLASMKKVTKFTSFLILPLGALLFAQAVFLRGTPMDAAVVATSAGLLGMLPKGLVLLISLGLAVGVIRLSRKNVLVRDLHSLENLAHCDVVCLDKTGTLTQGSLEVEGVYPKIDSKEFQRLMAAYLAYTDDNNATCQALRQRFSCADPYEVTAATPFSSARKWSSVTLSDGRTLVLGAPEKLCRPVPQEIEALMTQGKRVLMAGLCRGDVENSSIQPVATLVLSDQLRKNAAQTIRYLYQQGVDVKILSGDNPAAAATVARLSGVKNAHRLLDATGLTPQELAQAAETHTVFGRVTPEQKKVLVAALQKQGHKVAMTGDGVNDLLAMRQADCSAAMGNGSDAARQTAQLVLLDSDFAVLRSVISEGRRVVNNLTKSAGVFFIKTIYSVLLSALCLLLNTDFPFIPIQITLIDAVVEAFPAFFMSFERNDRRVEGSFLNSAFRSALPNSVAIFLSCLAVFFAAPRLGVSADQMHLVLYLTVGVVSLAGVVKASLPLNRLHALLSVASVTGFFCAVSLFAPLLQLPRLAGNGALLLPFVMVPGVLLALLLKFPLSLKTPLPGRK
ncbi:MAG: HAD-IC family P-type ATPase [Eubacteriales bacterium]|nr:HAD-IC family P-type ATPase [Eubacteriales bacterium]